MLYYICKRDAESAKVRYAMTATETRKMKGLKVIKKYVKIEDKEFMLIRFDANSDNLRKYYGDKIYGLIDYEFISKLNSKYGHMTRPLRYGEMAIADTPANAIDRMRKNLICRKWRKEHPEATDQEWMMYVVKVHTEG
jgi:hypothetical protein